MPHNDRDARLKSCAPRAALWQVSGLPGVGVSESAFETLHCAYQLPIISLVIDLRFQHSNALLELVALIYHVVVHAGRPGALLRSFASHLAMIWAKGILPRIVRRLYR